MEEQVTPISHPAPAPEPTQGAPQFVIAGFWRRVIAYQIDSMLFGIPLLILGYYFMEQVAILGAWGHMVQTIILIAYFSYFDSNLGKGRSIGKRIFKIRVIHKSGNYLTPKEAALRSLLVLPIWLFNAGWVLPLPTFVPSLIAQVIWAGGFLSLAYAFVFNKTTRQGLHDLIFNSYVVRGEYQENILQESTKKQKNITYGLWALGVIFGLLSTFVWNFVDLKSTSLSEYLELSGKVSEGIEGNPYVTTGYFWQETSSYTTDGSSKSSVNELRIKVFLHESCDSREEICKKMIRETARIAMDNYSKLNELTHLSVAVTWGFDLGPNMRWDYGESLTIEDWNKLLEENRMPELKMLYAGFNL